MDPDIFEEINRRSKSVLPISLEEWLHVLCANARMFTPQGTFEEVASWISGFCACLQKWAPDADEEWSGFIEWLPKRLNYPENYAWPYMFKKLYSDDQVAIRQLSSLYTEYIIEKHGKTG